MFNKKGDLTIRTIVLMIIGLMVLVTVVLIFLFGATEFLNMLKDLFASIFALKPDFTQ
ncbi:MAG: hypothetical protein ABIF40_00005 [archaeon]